TDVIARLGARFDQPCVFQTAIGFHDRIDADSHLTAQRPDGGDPLTGTVGSLFDHLAHSRRNLFVPQHGNLPKYKSSLPDQLLETNTVYSKMYGNSPFWPVTVPMTYLSHYIYALTEDDLIFLIANAPA